MNTSKSQLKKPCIGVIGLGIMGGVMAETLLHSGFKVYGYDIEAKAQLRLRKAGGVACANIADVVRNVDVMISSLASSTALAQVTQEISQAAQKHPSHAKILIETSTLPISDKESCAAILKTVRISTMDCPISGTAVRIQDRAWTIFASGAKATYQKI